ncbi:hypothetical protein [Ferdinandcohnia sp. SAFN-114]|uniref:hypothetical protein n=1 Tax=Ferdinandcohnia sp. SAFN-114 TaxID=3387275 RepID=UPI003F7D2293
MKNSAPLVLYTTSQDIKDKLLYQDQQNWLTENLLMLTYKSEEIYGDIVDIAGCGVVNNKFVMEGPDLKGNQIFKISPHERGSLIRGGVCIYQYSSSYKKVTISPDPLGYAMVNYYIDEDLIIISNELRDIVKLLGLFGKELNVCTDYFYEMIATGRGGFFSSPYEEIKVLEPFEFIVLDQEGNVTILEYVIKSDFFNIKETYNVLFEKGVQDISDNIISVGRYKNDGFKISHLTGGFDSRIVLSGIIGNDLKDDIYFYCSGSNKLPDKMIAEKLAVELDLKMTDFPGFNLKKNYKNFKEQLRLPLDFTGGIIASPASDYHIPNNNIVLSGGFGEYFRGSHGKLLAGVDFSNIPSLLEKRYGALLLGISDTSLLSEQFKTNLYSKVESKFNYLRSLGIAEVDLWEYTYLLVKTRYYIGPISYNWSKITGRFDPLYSLDALKSAFSLPASIRHENIMGFDILNYFSPILAQLPFDSNRYTKGYIEIKGEPVHTNFTKSGEPKYYLNDQIHKTKPVDGVKPEEIHIKKAKEVGAPLWQIVNLDKVQSELKLLFQSQNADKIFAGLNRKLFSRLINNDLKNRAHIRSLYSIYSTIDYIQQ